MKQSRGTTLAEALDGLAGAAGEARAPRAEGEVLVEVADVDRIGVRARSVRIDRGVAVDLVAEAARLPQRLRALGEPLVPVEVDPTLGGAVVRTSPEAIRAGEYFELDVRPRYSEVRRVRVDADGERVSADFTLTREQLDRLVDELDG